MYIFIQVIFKVIFSKEFYMVQTDEKQKVQFSQKAPDLIFCFMHFCLTLYYKKHMMEVSFPDN